MSLSFIVTEVLPYINLPLGFYHHKYSFETFNFLEYKNNNMEELWEH